MAPHSIGVDAGPAPTLHASQFSEHKPMTIGEKRGYMLRDDRAAIQFAFEYGTDSAGDPLWCVVLAPGVIPTADLERFIASLH
jgi:hypothetical protein